MRQILHTDFASPERLRHSDLDEQVQYVDARFDQDQLGEALPDVLTILNEHRQIVYANSRLFEMLGETKKNVLGKRPGEFLDCIHALESENGCGTTEFCRECGAVNAILDAQRSKQSVRECHILAKNGKAHDLQVWATPTYVGTKPFTIFTMKDISSEKRRAALERTFFHDLLNTAGSVHYASELMKAKEDEVEEFVEMISKSSIQLVEEIRSQRSLLAAERGELQIELDEVEPVQLMQNLAAHNQVSSAAEGRKIAVDPCSGVSQIKTDKVILRRCLNNLLKNALEAAKLQETVTIGCENEGRGIRFSISNPGYIPRKVQLQIFQRSFTTKGTGRGIGTYSVKLFVEQYLGGKTWFETNHIDGTSFYIYLPEISPLRDVDKMGLGNI